jgi:hypothetical protein
VAVTDARLVTLEDFKNNDAEVKVDKGAPSGYAPLDATGKVPREFIPTSVSDRTLYLNVVTPGDGASNGVMSETKPNPGATETLVAQTVGITPTLVKQFTLTATTDDRFTKDLE